jgi:NAD(P)-dependent dehydrogenase (short-subunit alcohol dehydrogenase family)
MTPSLDGRAALVTGGGSSIGLGCARWLVRDGARVTIAGRNVDRLRAAVAVLTGECRGSGSARWVRCDVTDEQDVLAAVAAASDAGGLDMCVAAAGANSGLAPVTRYPTDWFEADLRLNVLGTLFTLRHAGAAMARSGGGSFVHISSHVTRLTFALTAGYTSSKAAAEALIRVAADELGGAQVRVNCVRPGLVERIMPAASFAEAGLTDDRDVVADYERNTPLGRTGVPDDVAGLVRFLLGDESSWVTGQSIGVDGGNELRAAPSLAAFAGTTSTSNG